MDENTILTITGNYGTSSNQLLYAYMQGIKSVIISRFEDLAGEDIPPDFDKYSPDDLMILTRYRDGSFQLFPAGNQFTISL